VHDQIKDKSGDTRGSIYEKVEGALYSTSSISAI